MQVHDTMDEGPAEWRITPGVMTDLQHAHMPDILLRTGERGPAWILAGHPKADAQAFSQQTVDSEWLRMRPGD